MALLLSAIAVFSLGFLSEYWRDHEANFPEGGE